jgi:hypothetical protein
LSWELFLLFVLSKFDCALLGHEEIPASEEAGYNVGNYCSPGL